MSLRTACVCDACDADDAVVLTLSIMLINALSDDCVKSLASVLEHPMRHHAAHAGFSASVFKV